MVTIFARALLLLSLRSCLGIGEHYAEEDLHSHFNKFSLAIGRTYSNSTEMLMRYKLWKEKALSAKTLQSWTPFWGLTDEETSHLRAEMIASLAPNSYGASLVDEPLTKVPFQPFPAAYVEAALSKGKDWRKERKEDSHGKRVTDAKAQGAHGYCGTFMRVAVAEGQFARYEHLASLSEEQLIDCVGWDQDRYTAMIKTGLELEAEYPYVPGQYSSTPACKLDMSKIVARGYTAGTFPPASAGEDQLAAFLYHNGPFGAGIASTVFYSVDHDHWVTNCSSKEIDHAITAVGFGTHPTRGRYWIIKNSWGPSWQDHGFVYMPFGVNCGAFPNGKAEMIIFGDSAAYYYGANYRLIQSRNSSRCLYSNALSGHPLSLYSCNSMYPDQHWRMTQVSDKVQFHSRHSNLCLASNDQSGGLHVADCNTDNNDQLFIVIPVPNTSYSQVKSVSSGKCLFSKNDRRIDSGDCGDAWTDQHWAFNPVPEDPSDLLKEKESEFFV